MRQNQNFRRPSINPMMKGRSSTPTVTGSWSSILCWSLHWSPTMSTITMPCTTQSKELPTVRHCLTDNNNRRLHHRLLCWVKPPSQLNSRRVTKEGWTRQSTICCPNCIRISAWCQQADRLKISISTTETRTSSSSILLSPKLKLLKLRTNSLLLLHLLSFPIWPTFSFLHLLTAHRPVLRHPVHPATRLSAAVALLVAMYPQRRSQIRSLYCSLSHWSSPEFLSYLFPFGFRLSSQRDAELSGRWGRKLIRPARRKRRLRQKQKEIQCSVIEEVQIIK